MRHAQWCRHATSIATSLSSRCGFAGEPVGLAPAGGCWSVRKCNHSADSALQILCLMVTHRAHSTLVLYVAVQQTSGVIHLCFCTLLGTVWWHVVVESNLFVGVPDPRAAASHRSSYQEYCRPTRICCNALSCSVGFRGLLDGVQLLTGQALRSVDIRCRGGSVNMQATGTFAKYQILLGPSSNMVGGRQCCGRPEGSVWPRQAPSWVQQRSRAGKCRAISPMLSDDEVSVDTGTVQALEAAQNGISVEYQGVQNARYLPAIALPILLDHDNA